MDNSFMVKEIRRTSRNTLIIFGFFFLLSVLWIGSQTRYYYNCLFGPFDMTQAELQKIESPTKAWKYYVRVKGHQSIFSGLSDIEVRTDKKTGEQTKRVITSYMVLPLETRALLIDSPSTEPADSYLGELKPLDDNLKQALLANTDVTNMDIFLPFVLDTTAFKAWAAFLAVAQAGLLGLSLFKIRSALSAMGDPAVHAIAKRLAKLGNFRSAVMEIDEQLQAPDKKSIGKVAHLTKDWLILPQQTDCKTIPLKEMVWVYKKKTTTYIYFVIPVSVSNSLIIVGRDNKKYQLSIPEKLMDELLATLAERTSWIYLGFADDYQRMKFADMLRNSEQLYEEHERKKKKREAGLSDEDLEEDLEEAY